MASNPSTKQRSIISHSRFPVLRILNLDVVRRKLTRHTPYLSKEVILMKKSNTLVREYGKHDVPKNHLDGKDLALRATSHRNPRLYSIVDHGWIVAWGGNEWHPHLHRYEVGLELGLSQVHCLNSRQ